MCSVTIQRPTSCHSTLQWRRVFTCRKERRCNRWERMHTQGQELVELLAYRSLQPWSHGICYERWQTIQPFVHRGGRSTLELRRHQCTLLGCMGQRMSTALARRSRKHSMLATSSMPRNLWADILASCLMFSNGHAGSGAPGCLQFLEATLPIPRSCCCAPGVHTQRSWC